MPMRCPLHAHEMPKFSPWATHGLRMGCYGIPALPMGYSRASQEHPMGKASLKSPILGPVDIAWASHAAQGHESRMGHPWDVHGMPTSYSWTTHEKRTWHPYDWATHEHLMGLP